MENQMNHFVAVPQHYPVGDDIDAIHNFIFFDQSTLLSDEFRMYAYKIIQCPRNQSHDWTSCPFAHHGERARRRDPSRTYYTAVPCPKYKTGVCEKGDHCKLAHGVFESWLHPSKYKTRKCHAGEFCRRNLCFFAHTEDELRPKTFSTPYNPAMPERSTIGFESRGLIVLPSSQSRYGIVSSTHANDHEILLVSSSASAGTTGCDEVADSLAMLNIKDGEYKLPKARLIGQPKMTSSDVGSSLRSSYDVSCLDSIDLPQELKWIAELGKDS